MSIVALKLNCEIEARTVQAAGAICPLCKEPVFGTMVALTGWTSVGGRRTPVSLPLYCASCAGDELLLTLPQED